MAARVQRIWIVVRTPQRVALRQHATTVLTLLGRHQTLDLPLPHLRLLLPHRQMMMGPPRHRLQHHHPHHPLLVTAMSQASVKTVITSDVEHEVQHQHQAQTWVDLLRTHSLAIKLHVCEIRQ